jgi:protein ImuB
VSLWLCLRFEQLPLQSLSRDEERPVVVISAQRVLRANDCAAALGILEGMGTATVRALAADEPVQLLERDKAAEQRCLQQLCCWAYSITPALHTWRTDCLLLEVGSCLSLFQGLDRLLANVATGIGSRGYRASQGLAPTPRAAWLMSFADGANAMAADQRLEERLAPLPLSLLEDFNTTVHSLRRAGMHTLGDVLALPSSALARRCGREFSHFLQQVLGQHEDLHNHYQPPAEFSDEYWFGYEVKTNAELMPAIQQLLQSLCHFLRNTQLYTSEITWRLIGIDSKLRDIDVRSTSSHSDWRSWYQLTRIHLEQIQLDTGAEGLTLKCTQLRTGELNNIDLFSPMGQREPLAALLDRLQSRLGRQAIQKIGCRDEHLPELATLVSNDHPGDEDSSEDHCAQRPFWLMPQPQRLRHHGKRLYWNGPMELVYGPERIEDNWWREPVSRDYYIAETSSGGQHYWIFRDRLAGQWYIQGVFA